ncbi:MAG TPA: sugar phosphate nucleotidyltransferase [Thermomicrobiales bacterium]
MYVVIPAGGSGTRLWPLSRAAYPKFLHPLTGDSRTLIQATIDRLAALAPPERTFVVTGGAHVAPIARQIPDVPAANILVEPSPRDSAAAIGLAAAIIARRDPDAIMGSFHADHLVRDEDLFRETVRLAERAAREGYLMTIGIAPTVPETGYGYIRWGESLTVADTFLVEQFKEKPSLAVAEEWLAEGGYLWNSGMFVWRCTALLDELARQQPELYEGLMYIAESWDTPTGQEVLATIWPNLPKVPIDVAVMEGAAAAGRVGTVPGHFGWNDIGDWHTLGEVLGRDDEVNVVLGGNAAHHLLIDTQNTLLVPNGERIIATLGVQDLVIVDTPDALLVCARERAQDVKKLVDMLKERDHSPHL